MSRQFVFSRSVWATTGAVLVSGLLGSAVVIAQAPGATAKKIVQQPVTTPATPQTSPGPAVDTVSPQYKASNADPFADETKARAPRTPPPSELEYPSFEEREIRWRQIRDRRLEQGLPAPADSEKYLVDEFSVKGIYSTGRGLGALLTARRSGVTIFVREGSKFWNGSVTRIDRASKTIGLDTQIVGQVLCTEIVVLNNGKIKIKPRTLDYIPRAPK